MSSRRKGKPQQRKKIETAVEPDQDFVTCGDCQREFLLSDFVKYIQHKVNRCNKENVEPFEEPEFENEEDPEVAAVIPTQRTSISAPIQQEKLSPRPALPLVSQDADLPCLGKVEEADHDKPSQDKKLGNGPLNDTRRRARLVDTGSNTETQTEPKTFVCSKCKSQFSSPWFLLQHVQNHHGIQIYEETSPERKPSPSIHSRQNEITRKDLGVLSEPKPEPHVDRRGSSSTSSSTVVHSSAKSSIARSPSTQISPGGANSIFPHPSQPFPLPTSRQPVTPAFGSGLSPQFPRPPHLSQDAINRLMTEFNHNQNAPFGGRMPYPIPMDPGMMPGFPIHPTNEGLSNESVMAIYSRRLRELANPQPNPNSPPIGRKQNVHMFSQRDNKERRSSETNGSTFGHHTPSKSHSTEDLTKSLLPPKLKQCEFCNKTFRFQSNLIVHRRSHTGQKPYKCPLCPHACTQASKLKRHMKIHTKSLFGIGLSGLSSNNEDSLLSARSTPDYKYSKQDDDLLSGDMDESEEDEDELDEEELEAREREAEQEIDMLKQQVRRAQLARQEKHNDIDNSSVKDGDEPTDLSRRSVDSENGPTPVQTPNSKSGAETPTDLSMSRAALINEVMQDSPLVDMPMVKKAYLQAMEESKHGQRGSLSPTSDDTEKKSVTENGLENSPRGSCRSTPSSKQESPSPSHHPMDFSPGSEEVGEPMVKRVKSEPPERQHPMGRHPSFPSNLDLYHREIYPPPFPWFPRGPQEFMGLPRNDALLPYVHSRFQNGDNLLKSPLDNHKPRFSHGGLPGLQRQVVPPVTSPNGPPPGGIPGVPVRRRNDTCEFCGKIFKNCSNLTVHRRSHTGEKPYKCELCSYACAQSSKLTRHMKTHGRLGKDVYRCKFCSMPFSVPSTLEKHMRKCVENQQSRPLPSSMTNTDTTGSTSSVSSNVSVSSPVMQSPVESMPGMQSPVDMPGMQSPDSLPVMHS